MLDTFRDARSLRLMRRALSTLAALDALVLAGRTIAAAPAHPAWIEAAGWAGSLAQTPALVLALGALGSGAALVFARREGALVPGVVALVSLRLLHEAFAATGGLYSEPYYHVGAFLTGWLGGGAIARLLGARVAIEAERTWAERLSALCATAMLSATWMNAGISKLRDDWAHGAGGDVIRLMLLRHQAPGHATWRQPLADAIASSPEAADAIAWATLVIELGAFGLLLQPRVRAACATILFVFHLGTLLTAGIFFVQAVALALVVGVPWVALGDGLRRAAPAPPSASWQPQERALARVPAIALGLIAVTLAIPLAGVAPRSHPIDLLATRAPGGQPSGAVTSSDASAVQAFGPIRRGTMIEAWTVREIHAEDERAILALDDGAGGCELEVRVGSTNAPRGPFESGTAAISYRSGPRSSDDCVRAGEALTRALRNGCDGDDLGAAVASWLASQRDG